MTTLKSFQAEIEQISTEKHRQAIKDAREAHATAELARHHGKIGKKEVVTQDDVVEDESDEATEVALEVRLRMTDFELKRKDIIISDVDVDELRSRLASSLLRGHGEILIPLGAHPSPSHQYNPSAETGQSVETIGKVLSTASLKTALDRLRSVCEALKAELNELYRVEQSPGLEEPYGCWLVRLTPRGVEEIMEVRVAVVGNVDAGKSTTLGVLTRGALDDGRGKVCA